MHGSCLAAHPWVCLKQWLGFRLVFRRVDSVASTAVDEEYYGALTRKIWKLRSDQKGTREAILKRDSHKSGATASTLKSSTETRRANAVATKRKHWRKKSRHIRVLDLITAPQVTADGVPLRAVTPAVVSSASAQRKAAEAKEGIRILTPLERGYEAFLQQGNLDQAFSCVARGQDINYLCSAFPHDTLLTLAVQKMAVTAVQSALAKGASAQLCRGDGRSALDLAMQQQQELLARRSKVRDTPEGQAWEQRLKDVSAICAILTLKIENEIEAEEELRKARLKDGIEGGDAVGDAPMYDYFTVESVIDADDSMPAEAGGEESKEVKEAEDTAMKEEGCIAGQWPRMNPDFLVDESGRPVEIDEDDEGIWNWQESDDEEEEFDE